MTKPMKVQTCKNCSSTFEVRHGNARYCSPECRPAVAAKKKVQTRAEMWAEHNKEVHELKLEIMRSNPHLKYEEITVFD